MNLKPEPKLYFQFKKNDFCCWAEMVMVAPDMDTGGMMWKITTPPMPHKLACHGLVIKFAGRFLPSGARVVPVDDIEKL